MALQEEMAVLNGELKQRRTQAKALKDIILRIMESSKVAVLSTSKATIVHKTRDSAEKISNDYLLKHCKDFFQGDEEKARSLVKYLEEHRGTIKKHDLKIQTKAEDNTSNRS